MKTKNAVPKKLLSVLLAVLLLFSAVSVGLIFPDFAVSSDAAEVKSYSAAPGALTFVVPEAIYLYPDAVSWKEKTTTPFQYYINNDKNGNALPTYSPKGYIYFNYADATGARLSHRFLKADMSEVLDGGSISYESPITPNATTPAKEISTGTAPQLDGGNATNQSGCYIEWTVTFTDSADNQEKKAVAYTYVYKPYTVPTGTAIRIKCKAQNQQFNWMTGFHSIEDKNTDNGDGLWYPFLTTTAVFSSKDTDAYIDGTNITTSSVPSIASSAWGSGYSKVAGGTTDYLLFAETGTSTYHFVTSSDNKGVGDWFSSTDDDTKTYPYPFVYEYSEQDEENRSVSAYARYQGKITIDTSRYTDLSQIPNLAVGMMVTCDQDTASGGNWYVADMTDLDSLGNLSQKDSGNANTMIQRINYSFAGQGDGRTTQNGNESEGVKYCGSWVRQIISADSASSSQVYTVHFMNGNRYYNKVVWAETTKYYFTHGQIALNATQYNKLNLRTAVNNATSLMAKLGVNGAANGLLTSVYFDDADASSTGWATFQSAYKDAVMALTTVDGAISNPDNLATALNNAIKGLKTKLIIDKNDGVTAQNTEYVSIGTDAYNVVASVSHTPTQPARNGYSFKGWNTDKNAATGTKTNVSIGYNNTLYAIWEPITYTATFYVPTLNGKEKIDSKNYTIESSFAFLSSANRDYYTFDGKWKIEAQNGSWSDLSAQYAAGTYSAVGNYGHVNLIAQFTPIEYTISYDPNNGQAVVDGGTYNYESVINLPTGYTYTGYSFAGWKPKSASGNWAANTDYQDSVTNMHGSVQLVGDWVPATSTVTLNVGSDVILNTSTTRIYSFASALELPTPIRHGYNFLGWKITDRTVPAGTDIANQWVVGTEYLLEIGADKVSLPANKLGNVTLEPIWSDPITYTVTYQDDMGVELLALKQNYTVETNLTLNGFSKNGYTFTGWSKLNAVGEHNWNASSYSAGNIGAGFYGNVTLKATVNTVGYTVSFDLNGGTGTSSDLTYTINNSLLIPTDAAKTAYTFKGWRVSANSGSWVKDTVYNGSLPDGNYGNVSLKAVWEATEYTLSYESSGTNSGERTYTKESASFTLPASELTGYDFGGWRVTAGVGNWTQGEIISSSTPIQNRYGDVTLEAVFVPKNYTVTYQNPNGSTYSTTTYTIQNAVTVPGYSANGYDFNGWRVVSTTGGGLWEVGALVTPGEKEAGTCYGNAVLTPDLTPKSYRLTFEGTSYTGMDYTIESTDKLLPEPTKEGYDFAGWKVTAAAGNWSLNAVIAGGTAVTGYYGSATLTATWNAKKYNITYIVGNTTAYPSGIVIQSEYDKMPVTPTEAQTAKPQDAQYTYTFTGWSPSLNIVKGEATYTAQYQNTLRSYQVTWMVPSETAGSLTNYAQSAQNTVDYGVIPVYNNGTNPQVTSLSPDDYSWRFMGWSTTQGGTQLAEIPAVTGAVTYYAVFKKVLSPQRVDWVINGVVNADAWSPGDTPVWQHATPTKPDENGYYFVFDKWTPDIVPVEVGHTYTYTAQFLSYLQTYTVSFEANGGNMGSNPASKTYQMGDTVSLPTPVKNGYTFAGWKVTAQQGTWTLDTLYSQSSVVTTGLWGNVTLTAQYTPITYHITFNKASASDTVPDTMDYTMESSNALPYASASREGYTLIGWVVSVGDGNWEQGSVLEKDYALLYNYGNVTLTPRWQINTYTVTWISGELTQESEVEYGSAILAFTPLSRVGYTAGWDYEIPEEMPAHDLTFTAVYTAESYYIHVQLNGGTGADNFYYTIESENVLPAPTKVGADFGGWRVTSAKGSWVKNAIYDAGTSLKGKYGGITITAVWKPYRYTVTWVAGDITRKAVWFYGSTPSYDSTPYKSPDKGLTYTFTGWDKPITPVTGDVTYTALFEGHERDFTVIWNIDGYTVSESYPYGTYPTYKGAAPARESTSATDYEFTGWSPEITKVEQDTVYTAQFTAHAKIQRVTLDIVTSFVDLEGSCQLTASIYPLEAASQKLKWVSMNPSVVEIDENGRAYGLKPGAVLVYVASQDETHKAYCMITVAPKLTSYIELTARGVSTTQNPGTSIQIFHTIYPDNASNQNVIWSSSNPAVASVDQNGLVSYHSVGEAVITAKAEDGYCSGSITVKTVTPEEAEQDKETVMILFGTDGPAFILNASFENGYSFVNREITSASYIVLKGSTVEFKVKDISGYYVMANSQVLKCDSNGVYRIENVTQKTVIAIRADNVPVPDDTDEGDAEPTFFSKLQAILRAIVTFFRNIFKLGN